MSLLLALTAVAPEPPTPSQGGGNRLFTPRRDDELTDAELDALLVALLLAA